LKLIRSYLIELMSFNHIQLSILTLINLPSRLVHPIYSRKIRLATYPFS
jgi:hypothetical protein